MKKSLDRTCHIAQKIVPILALGALISITILAADGDLDTTFDTDGRVTTDFNSSPDSGRAMAIQADGKIVVAGTTNVSGLANFALVRYNPDGSLDTSFGGNGKVNTLIGSGASAQGMAIQTDGKIVVVGIGRAIGQSDFDFVLARYNPNGSLDTNFNLTGTIIFTFASGSDDVGNAIVIQSDGKIVVAGQSFPSISGGSSSFALARFNTNGSFDTGFDTDGKLLTSFAVSSGANSVAVQADGKIVAAGISNLARYETTGALDTTFGTGGRVFVNNSGINALAIQSDGNLVIAGSNGDFTLTRLTPAGVFDTSFGTNGRVFTAFQGFDTAFDVVLQPDGKIIVAGQSNLGDDADFALARYLTNGTLDSTFGTNGKLTTTFVNNNDEASAVALQADGKIVAAGRSGINATADFALARYQNGAAVVQRRHLFDFDGDSRDDFSVFRPSNGTWYINRSSDGFFAAQWGLSDDRLAPADYDGDGRTDIAVFRENGFGDPDRGVFFILQSAGNTVRQEQFGRTGDNPSIVGDWNGDGLDDLAVYRGGTGGGQSFFFYRTQAGSGFTALAWGTDGDIPVRGDYDGDAVMDAAVFRPSNSTWFIRRSSDGNLQAIQWGTAGDRPAAADYDGDGRTDLAVFRPSDRVWYILQSSNNQPRFQQWGLANDKLTPADYDGDGKTDIAVWRDADQTFYVLQSAGSQFGFFRFGLSQDVPIASAFFQ